MRRTVFVAIAGLIFAFTFFYVVAWPSSVSSESSIENSLGFDKVKPGELLYAGIGPFKVIGRKKVTVVTVKLHDGSPGIELVDTRLDLYGPGFVGLGAEREGGELVPQLEKLPHAPDADLRPGQAGGLYVAFRLTDPGSYRFRGVEIVYQAGWLTRTAIVGPSVTAEVPAA